MVHRFKNNGYNILLDENSGSVHVVDELAYEAMGMQNDGLSFGEIEKRLCAKYDPCEVDETLKEIELLTKDGSLYTEDVLGMVPDLMENREFAVKALCLHVAHDCNLSCRYCFAQEGKYHAEREMMSFETGKRALDFLMDNSGNRVNLEVDFFGGEPLMNWRVVKELVTYARSQEGKRNKKFRFTLTTNGVLIDDEVIEFCNEHMSNVVLSIDGRKDIHDRMRPFRGGAGSYEHILPKLKRFADSRGQENYYVRGTFTHFNTDFAKDVLHLADLGFKQISIEPVVAPESEEYAIKKEDLPAIKEQYDILAKEMARRIGVGERFNFFHFMIDLEGGPCIYKRLSGCGSGTEYLAVTPNGDIYPCHQFVGTDGFRLGSVYEGVIRTEVVRDFAKVNVYSKDECKSCFARFFCSGGCAANSYGFGGRIDSVYETGCEMQKKRVECALMLKCAEAGLHM